MDSKSLLLDHTISIPTRLTLKSEERTGAPSVLAEPRFERLLTIGQQINDLRSKIRLATEYIGKAEPKSDVEDVVLAREALRGDLERDFEEARDLMPIVDELVAKFDEQAKSIESRKKLHQGLAKIEGLAGRSPRLNELEGSVESDRAQIAELENLISALTELEKDLTGR